MSTIAPPERITQNRVVVLFVDELGYRYLGNWQYRDTVETQNFASLSTRTPGDTQTQNFASLRGNSNVEGDLLTAYLRGAGYSPDQINRALHRLRVEADNPNRTLYANNQAVYKLLRYGVPVKREAGQVTDTIHLVNWAEPAANDFAIAEEVTLHGQHDRRPDIVLYLNGIAVAVLELKRSFVSIGEGIRQNISNQRAEFNAWFFSTVQLVFAGNDAEGLRYGTVGTEQKYFLTWKEDEQDNSRYKLDKYLLKMCAKGRLLELIHDFVLFDGGVKKVPRVHQYFAIRAAQRQVAARTGGIIWHSQGSGKSIVMVLLAKWILEHNPNGRVVVITDRDELDKQIERVFTEAGESIHRTGSGRDLMAKLGQATPRLLCSLVHKFGQRDVEDFDAFIADLASQPSHALGDLFIFVDECHRTQSGKLHRAMKALLPDALFIGFTGTPLLKKDAQTSLEIFGGYIHTYKFDEAVEDGVVLDLVYEARDIDQRLGSQGRIDAWFDARTRGLNDWQKGELRNKWGTMQNVLSSRARMDQVVNDILMDFSIKPRLSDARGNAMLVAASIYEACKYFTLFQRTPFKGKCAVVTSYNPQARDISLEDTGANSETDKTFIYNTYTELLAHVQPRPGKSKTETYEDAAKKCFIEEPAQMRLLIVVDKLLTGFDAPSCTYLYIDKSMQDHGLFQAICRTNRLDGDDKEFGYIVDYKDLFKKVENAIAVYTAELDQSAGGDDPQILLQDRLQIGRARLDGALESLALLCEPVQPPRSDLDYIHYFCGNTEIPTDVAERAPRRVALYKAVVALLRAYAAIADELPAAGYTPADSARIQRQQQNYLRLRQIVRNASGESLDLKAYEADMRHLIDTYIQADEPRTISPFANLSLTDLIVKTGIAQAIADRLGNLRGNQAAIAETIENNVRSIILAAQLTDPAYYDRMSALLQEIIAARKARAIEYEEYLQRIAELARQATSGQADAMPAALDTPGRRALYNNLAPDTQPGQPLHEGADFAYRTARDDAELLALRIDEAIKRNRYDSWRGVPAREQMIKRAMYEILQDVAEVERLFPIVFQQTEY